MSTKYKLVVSNTVAVTVAGTLKDEEGKDKPFKFELICKRKGADEMKKEMADGILTKEVLREVTTDWRGQRLVLEQDDTPAPFNADSFDALLDIGGMAAVCFNAYYSETSVTAKN